MFLKWALLLACAYFSTCEAAYVLTLKETCSIKDEDCLKIFLQNLLKDISVAGIKEYGIPIIDPIEIKDMVVSVPDAFNMSIVEATVKGIKDTVVTRLDIKLEKGKTIMECECDIDIKGKYKVIGSNPMINQLFGSDSIHGDGNFKLQLKKLKLTLVLHWHLQKNADGDVFFIFHNDDFRYKYVIGDPKIDADNIFVGNVDASKVVIEYMNNNWPIIMETFGGGFFNESLKIMNNIIDLYSTKVPTRLYIKEDLTSYART